MLLRVIRTSADVWATMPPLKRWRNKIYRSCGWMIVGCIVMILASNAFHWDLLFWFESIAVEAFGISWLVNGGALLGDPDRSMAVPLLREQGNTRAR
jgi:hypothetical protein